jgi:hypothetical protein
MRFLNSYNLKKIKKLIKAGLNTLPYIKSIHRRLLFYEKYNWVPPGHYYSPIVNKEEVLIRIEALYGKKEDFEGIKLNVDKQLMLVQSFKELNPPFTESASPDLRYYYQNNYYSYSDGLVLFGMLNTLQPRKVIEVGSGFSSALFLDFKELNSDMDLELSFIEPFPENRLNKLIKSDDHIKLYQNFVQDVPLDIFERLNKNDILFIDSSHVSKAGSDLNHMLFNILPILKSGVIIHFHDIAYPFEYPLDWIEEGRSWNEIYLLRAFLMHNTAYETMLFTSYLSHLYTNELKEVNPLFSIENGSSFWIRKL